ncbi:DMT family transporter [Nocardioides dongxiaopingii]|uniref:DMT family transporter n=1 Tax=Nocardioides dongxiaopingii TaxID=2576036 RepID=UPI001FE42E4A|nr:DMT family transporter [Nocardioides dongxiaopingii]
MLPGPGAGLRWGLLGVVAFSFTVPMTRVALGGLSPLLVGSARAVVAAGLAALCLGLARERLPRGRQWARLAVVGAGVVVGFPLLTSYALTTAPASHGAVVVAVLPAATAVTTVVRSGERPRRAFWVAAAAGAVAALVFASFQGDGFGGLHRADLLLVAAVLAAAVGYAEGGLLARELGAWQTISWALVGCAPPMLALALVALRAGAPQATPTEWAAFGYLAVVSMFLGFLAWYRGLAIGPMASVSQVQLAQPVLTIAWAGLLLGEEVTTATVLGGVAVVACAAGAVRVRSAPAGPPGAARARVRRGGR